MRRKVTLLTLTLAFLIGPMMIAGIFHGPSPSLQPLAKHYRPADPYLTSILYELGRHITSRMADSGVPGAAVAVVKDSSVVYLKGFGKRSIDSSANVDINSVFRVGSISKCFAGVLTATLVHDGLLNWDDQVIKYLPDFKLKTPEATEKLTIRDVLSHRTGLPPHSYTTLVEDGLDLQTMLDRLADVNVGEVGKYYSYQNVAFSLIGKIIEKVTGKSYEENLRERIFLPLGMWDASASYEGITSGNDVALPSKLHGWTWKQEAISPHYYNVAPAGGVNASASDMAKWMKALLGYRPDVINAESLNEIFAPEEYAPLKNYRYRHLGRIRHSAYGLGWRVLYYTNDTIVYHSGYVNGYLSEVAIDRTNHIGVCVLSSAPASVAVESIPYFLQLFDRQQDSIDTWDQKERLAIAKK